MSGPEMFKVIRVIGNNVVLVHGGGMKEYEYVILGKGIGFGTKVGGTITSEDPRIEKLFKLEDQEQWNEYRLLEEFDPKVLEITDEILNSISVEFPGKLNDKVYLALPSHIQFTIYRLRKGMDIINPFLEETKISFPREYEIALKAADMIGQAFGIKVPEDEVGFLTYHVYSAVSHVPVGQLVKASNMVGRLIEIIERERGIAFESGSMDHVRLLMHLRFSVDRLLHHSVNEDNPFADQIKSQFIREYKLASQLAHEMEHNLGRNVPEAEICFLAMHLYRLFRGRTSHKQERIKEET